MRAVLADGLDRRRDAGAVDEAHQLAERDGLGDHALAVGLLAHVAPHEAAADLGRDGFAGLGLQIGDDDLGAVRREHARRAFAEARGAAGDDEYLACDFHGGVSFQASAARARALISSTLPMPSMRRYFGAPGSPDAAQRW